MDHNPLPFLKLQTSIISGFQLVNHKGPNSRKWCQTSISLCDGNFIKKTKTKKNQHAHTRALLYKSITTNLPTKKHPQGKVELCHQFPLKNSPPVLGKNEGSASSVLGYLSCAHIKRGGWAFEQQQAKNKSGKHEGKAGECDVMLSVIHAFTLCSREKKRESEGEKEKSGALSQWANFFGFQNASLLQPTNPLRPSMLRVPHKERCADAAARVHTIALANPNIFLLLANAHTLQRGGYVNKRDSNEKQHNALMPAHFKHVQEKVQSASQQPSVGKGQHMCAIPN